MIYKHKTTGEEVKPYSELYYICSDTTCIPKRFIEDSLDWEKVIEKDYEIIRYGDEKGNLWENGECIASYLGDGKTHIFSVKRLSDGEVFSIDEVVSLKNGHNKGKLNSITLTPEGKLYMVSCEGGFGQHLEDLCKIKEPLFKTLDGVDIYGGESIYAVSDDFQLFYTSFARETDRTVRSFAKKENAEKYIAENSKRFSLEDIRGALKATLPSGLGGYPKWEGDFTKDFEEYLLH